MIEPARPSEIIVSYSAGDIGVMLIMAWRYWLVRALFPFVLLAILSMVPVVAGDATILDAFSAYDWQLASILSLILVGSLLLILFISFAVRRWRGFHDEIAISITNDGPMFRAKEMERDGFLVVNQASQRDRSPTVPFHHRNKRADPSPSMLRRWRPI